MVNSSVQCPSVTFTRCTKTVIATAVVRGLFEKSIPLVCGGATSFAVSRDLTYLFSAKVTPLTKIMFFRWVLSICVKTIREIKITFTFSYWNKWYVLSKTPKLARPLEFFRLFGDSKHDKMLSISNDNNSAVKFFRPTTSSGEVVWTGRRVKKFSNLIYNYTFNNHSSAPSNDAMRAFKSKVHLSSWCLYFLFIIKIALFKCLSYYVASTDELAIFWQSASLGLIWLRVLYHDSFVHSLWDKQINIIMTWQLTSRNHVLRRMQQ